MVQKVHREIKPRRFRRIRRWCLALVISALAFFGYVEWANSNSPQMTFRQKILKAVYPAWMWVTRATGKRSRIAHTIKAPTESFYSLRAAQNGGEEFDFTRLRGRKVLIVNTASNCGYTGQYDELQKLYERYAGTLEILAFPSNDFKEQEKGSDAEIAEFCRVNFGVKFPLMAKTTVARGGHQHEVYRWLTDSARNGWNSKAPSWNFSKYLVDEQGRLTSYFDPSISPLGVEVIRAIEKKENDL